MSFYVWLAAGLTAAVFLFLLASSAIYARTANRTANYAILLLLDEFAYAKQRKEFLALIEQTKTDSYFALYHAVMLALEDAAKAGEARRVPLTARIWKLNQSFTQTGRSAVVPGTSPAPAESLPTSPSPTPIGAFRIVQEEYPYLVSPRVEPPSPEDVHKKNVKAFETAHRILKWFWAWRRRLKQMLGLR